MRKIVSHEECMKNKSVVGEDTIVKRDPDLIVAEMGDDLLVMSGETEKYHGLNFTARAVFELTEDETSARKIAEALVQQFDIAPDTCMDSVVRTLDSMVEMKLLQVVK